MATNLFSNLKLLDRKTISFTLSPTRVTYANTLRRIIQTEVPCLGFRADMSESGTTTDVKIIKNTTPMSNEMLADRIGLIPIAPQKGSGWKRNSVLFKLHVKNETNEVRYVTASDFECIAKKEQGEEYIPNTQFFHPDPITQETCLISILKPYIEGQPPEELHIEAYATMGKGREHARFNPTSQCSYGYTRDTDPEKIMELWRSWLIDQKKTDPMELEKKDNAQKKEELNREFRSLSINRCYKTGEDGEANSFDFVVESVTNEQVTRIIHRGILYSAGFSEQFGGIDKGDLPDNIEIRPADARLKGFDFWFTNVDGHTLGNMLQTWLDDNKIGNGVVTYAGYKVPHPLRNEFVFRIGVEDGKEETARLMIAEAAKGCSEMFKNWSVEWNKAVLASGITTELYEEDLGEEPESEVDKSVWQIHGEMRERIEKGRKEREQQKEGAANASARKTAAASAAATVRSKKK